MKLQRYSLTSASMGSADFSLTLPSFPMYTVFPIYRAPPSFNKEITEKLYLLYSAHPRLATSFGELSLAT